MKSRENRYHRYKKAMKWAAKQTLDNWDEIVQQSFRDMLVDNTTMWHIGDTVERIEPYSEEYWDKLDRYMKSKNKTR